MRISPSLLSFLSLFTIVQNKHCIGLGHNQVILTFDDGPNGHHQTTERLLDVLQARNIKACFCVVGKNAVQHPDTIRRIHGEGHLIANHSQSHGFTLVQNAERIRQEIAACDEALGGILGIPNYRSQAFRPPGGFLTPPVKKVVRQKGLKLVPISFYAVDTLYRVDNYQTVVNWVLQDARQKRGGIYVLHDGRDPLWGNERTALEPKHGLDRSWIPQGVAQIVDELTKEGMAFLDPTDFFKAASF